MLELSWDTGNHCSSIPTHDHSYLPPLFVVSRFSIKFDRRRAFSEFLILVVVLIEVSKVRTLFQYSFTRRISFAVAFKEFLIIDEIIFRFLYHGTFEIIRSALLSFMEF